MSQKWIHLAANHNPPGARFDYAQKLLPHPPTSGSTGIAHQREKPHAKTALIW